MSEGSPPSRSRYLVEWYQPALSNELLEQTARQIDRSTAELSKEGTVVDLLLTLFVPDDVNRRRSIDGMAARGESRAAPVAVADSPEKPWVPLPAMVVMRPVVTS